MIWAGSPFARLIKFSTGLPTGAVSFQLLGNANQPLHSGTITPAAQALSHLLVIDAVHNSVATKFVERRTLTWSYLTATGAVSDRVVYIVQKPLPFAVSCDGVRNQLGVSAHELTDEQINLPLAYAEFAALVPAEAITAAQTAGDRTTLVAIDAVEAFAALLVLPSIQLRAGQLESNGTNEFSRFRNIDWEMLRSDLQMKVDRGRVVIDKNFNPVVSALAFFGTAPRTPDPITGV